jgi:Skp family chaperone for outer membrane proteins
MKRISIAAVLVMTTFAVGASAQTTGRTGAPAQNPPAQTPARPPAAPPASAPQTPPPATPAARPAPPAPVPFPAGAKIGFVNMQLVVAESKLGKAGQDKMMKLREANQAKLTVLAKGIQDQQQKISTQTGVVTDAVLQGLNRELSRLQLDAQAAQQKANAEEQNMNEDLLGDFSSKAMPIIDAVRTEKDLWFILGVQEPDQGGSGQLIVASANAGLDLSLEIVKRLDAKFPGTEGQ